MRTFSYYLIMFLLFGLVIQTSVQAQHRRYYDRHYSYDRRYSYDRYPRISYRSFPVYTYRRAPYYFNHPYVNLYFGGINYRYYDGYFYRPYGATFSVVFPPIGIHINVLPRGYRRIYVGPDLYYYYNGIFYRNYDDNYEVVTPPVGAEVAEVPEGAKVVVIDNKKYYEYHGTYYREFIKENGETWYRITGKKGVVTSTEEGDRDEESYQQDAAPEIGSIVNDLPENSKTIITNNQKYFVAPDNTYYQEEIENNQVHYKVVPKPSTLRQG